MPNPFARSWRLRTLLCLLLAVVLAPTLLIQAYIYYERFDTRRTREFDANLEVARATSRAFDAYVQSVLQQELTIGLAVATSHPLRAADLTRLLAESARSTPAVREYCVLTASGQVVASSEPSRVGTRLPQLCCLQEMASGSLGGAVSDLNASDPGVPTFTISRVIRGARGGVIGIIAATILPEQLSRVLPGGRSGNASVALLDRQGMLVFSCPSASGSSGQERDWRARYPILRQVLAGKEATATLIAGSPGRTCYFAMAPIASLGWAASASRTRAEALTPVFASLHRHTGMFVAVALAAFAAALGLARPITAAIERLRSHALALGSGEQSDVHTCWAPAEVKELTQAFNSMAAMIQQREQELRESEQRYRELVQNANCAIIRCRRDGTISFFNEFAEFFFGYRSDEAVGRPISLVMPGTEAPALTATLLAHPESSRSMVIENLLQDGRRVWMTWANRPILDEQGQVVEILTIGSDITALKATEEALRESEERFRTVVDNLTEGLFIHNRSGRILYQNSAAVRLHGYEGRWPGFSAEQAAATWQVSDRSGAEVPFDDWVFHRVLKGEAVKDEVVRVRHREGLADFWASYRGVPIFDRNGRIRYALITMRDESARVSAEDELRRVNRRLEQTVSKRTAMLAESNEALRKANQQIDARARQLAALAGELTMAEQRERRRLSKILHDGLQQHLAAAKLQLGGIQARLEQEDLGLGAIEEALGESIRMSRSLSADLSPPALFEGGLQAGLQWLVRRMRERHCFEVDLAAEEIPDLPEDVKILVFESVRELLFNSFKHSRRLEAQVRLRPAADCGIEITVKDRGVGFQPAQLQSAGDPGGGFGLFSIRERLSLIGGHLAIDSAPGKGCCFSLRVPSAAPAQVHTAAARAVPPEWTEHAAPGPRGAFIRVLLADDHTLFREGLARLLGKEVDIEVVGEAGDGEGAVALCRRLSPDVILMDINMPKLNGIEATRLIHRESPNVRIVGLSMHEAQERAAEMFEAGAIAYKSKTCPAAELIAAVRG